MIAKPRTMYEALHLKTPTEAAAFIGEVLRHYNAERLPAPPFPADAHLLPKPPEREALKRERSRSLILTATSCLRRNGLSARVLTKKRRRGRRVQQTDFKRASASVGALLANGTGTAPGRMRFVSKRFGEFPPPCFAEPAVWSF